MTMDIDDKTTTAEDEQFQIDLTGIPTPDGEGDADAKEVPESKGAEETIKETCRSCQDADTPREDDTTRSRQSAQARGEASEDTNVMTLPSWVFLGLLTRLKSSLKESDFLLENSHPS